MFASTNDDDFIQTKYGYCWVSLDNNFVNIYGLFVHPPYRRQGHARRILELAKMYLQSQGLSMICIEAAPFGDDTAPKEVLFRLYQSLGFRIYGKR